jgi:hypothetical protein
VAAEVYDLLAKRQRHANGEAATTAFDPAAVMPASLTAALERDAGVARAEAAEAAAAKVVPYSTRGLGDCTVWSCRRERPSGARSLRFAKCR